MLILQIIQTPVVGQYVCEYEGVRNVGRYRKKYRTNDKLWGRSKHIDESTYLNQKEKWLIIYVQLFQGMLSKPAAQHLQLWVAT